jgi:hypothetical protein
VTSIANVCAESTTQPPCSAAEQAESLHLERKLQLVNSVSDHRMATRDRYSGAERLAYLRLAEQEIRMALDGATIETILESRSA